jgi:hypothetical protein
MSSLFFMIIAGTVAGCTVSGIERDEGSSPTITFKLDSLAEFEQAGRRADDWCRQHHRQVARFVDSKRGGGYGSEAVTFECIGDPIGKT